MNGSSGGVGEGVSCIPNGNAAIKFLGFDKVSEHQITVFIILITYRAKLMNPDWLRQSAFFLITGALLVIKRALLLDADWLSTPAVS